MNDTLGGLWVALESDWGVLPVLADALEEAGDDSLAAGVRAMLRSERRPWRPWRNGEGQGYGEEFERSWGWSTAECGRVAQASGVKPPEEAEVSELLLVRLKTETEGARLIDEKPLQTRCCVWYESVGAAVRAYARAVSGTR